MDAPPPRRRLRAASSRDRIQANGLGCAGRMGYGVLIYLGTGVVSLAWRDEHDVAWFVAVGVGLVMAGAGVYGWAMALPAGGIRPRRPLSADPASVRWTKKRIAAAVIGVLLIILSPTSCVATSFAATQAEETWTFLLGLAAAALGVGLLLAALRDESNWHARRRAAKARAERPDDAWTWDRAWNPRGEKRRFFRYTKTRAMFVGRVAVLYFLFLLPVRATTFPRDAPVVALKIAFGVGVALWAWRMLTVFFMGDAFVGFRRFPCHPDEPIALTFGVSEGSVEIRDARFALHHLREHRDSPAQDVEPALCTATYEERGSPPPRTFFPGVDQELFFDLPRDAPGTSISAALASYWELEVRGVTRLGPYEERFLVPIYARPTSVASG